jgi:hypothetical protein
MGFHLLASALLIMSACSKNSSTPTFTPGYTIYFAGQSNSNAVYWKNGQQIHLANNADAYSITLSDTNVYISGTLNFDGLDIRATYWKNGQQVQLESTGTSHAFGIAVSGNDVYCGGDYFGPVNSGRVAAVYWKNGNRIPLSPSTNGVARSIYVFGSTVYIAGQVWGSFDSAVVWKNSVQTWYGIPGSMNAIGISANDTFFVGNFNGATYWTQTRSKTLSLRGFASSISVNGSDVYIGGGIRDPLGNPQAGYWKNDVYVPLSNDYKTSAVSAVAVAGNDVYAGGYIYDGTKYVAVYWKNSVMTRLSDRGEVKAICIRKEKP